MESGTMNPSSGTDLWHSLNNTSSFQFKFSVFNSEGGKKKNQTNPMWLEVRHKF